MPTCQGRYAPPEAVALLLPQARTILKYALFYHGTGHLQKILNIAPALRSQLAETESAIGNILKAIEQGIFTPSTKQRLDELEARKE